MNEEKRKENKSKAMRLSDDNAAWWDEFVKESKEKLGNGSLSQNDAFSMLRQAAEIGGIKAKVPGRVDEIDDVRHLCEQFVTKYLSAVEGIAIAKEKAEEDVKGQINKLQNQIETLTNDVACWKERYDEESEQRNNLSEKVKENLNIIESQKETIENLKFVNGQQKEMIEKKDKEIVKMEEQLKNTQDMTDMMQTIAEMREFMKKTSADGEEDGVEEKKEE